MATSPEDYMVFFQRCYGRSCDPSAMLLERLERLDTIVETLRSSPLGPWIRVFGSAVDKPDMLPGDIDVFLDLSEVTIPAQERNSTANALLHLAVAGGYHGNVGSFDPFILDRKGSLLCRNDGTTRYNVGWRLARNAKALTAAGRSGVLLTEFDVCFKERFSPSRSPIPG